MRWSRALAAWAAIIVVESLHGVVRQLWIAPHLGDLRARQVGVLVGSALIFVVAWVFSRAMRAATLRQQLAVGAVWVALTLAFEIALGAALGLTRERMLADYDVANGGFMAFGLLFELLAPAFAARLRGHP
jgi:hypothetical protein